MASNIAKGARLGGKVALITGAAGGIGAATARLFCAQGAKVVLVDRALDELNRTGKEIRAALPAAEFELVEADVTDPSAAHRCVELAVQRFGALHNLVNNAAERDTETVAASTNERWRQVLEVNLLGAASFCRAALPALRAAGNAAIVNVASCYGVRGRKGFAAYDASKAALLALTRSLAVEEADHGVRVNAVCPGGTLTPYTLGRGRLRGHTEAEMRAEPKADSLLKRWAEPIEVSYPILWLASDEASYITGTALMVDGALAIL
jgi:2-hydroxycyclohexanecarboxyl-CoA dehydrogenase